MSKKKDHDYVPTTPGADFIDPGQHLEDLQRSLSWLDKLTLFDSLVNHPRRFVARATHTEHEAALWETKPKVDPKVVSYASLRLLLDHLLPEESKKSRFASERKMHRYFLLNKMGDLPSADMLETAVSKHVSLLFPTTIAPVKLTQKEAQDYFNSLNFRGKLKPPVGLTGDDPNRWLADHWRMHKERVVEWVQTILQDIDDLIIKRIKDDGETHPDIIPIKTLPPTSLFITSAGDLFWEKQGEIKLAAVYWDSIPKNHPLRELDERKLPRLNRTGGAKFIILGPSIPHVLQSLSRTYYYKTCTEAFTSHAWKVWSERHKHYLASNLDSEEESKQYFEHLKLMKEPWYDKGTFRWVYPDPPKPPPLDTFQDRTVFTWDAVGRWSQYLPRPSPNVSLDVLLQARRIFTSAGSDQHPQPTLQAAKTWVGRFLTVDKRLELLEALWELAKSSCQAIEDLECLWREKSLLEYQSSLIGAQ